MTFRMNIFAHKEDCVKELTIVEQYKAVEEKSCSRRISTTIEKERRPLAIDSSSSSSCLGDKEWYYLFLSNSHL